MFCNKCGDIVEPNEKFCNKCGNPLNVATNNNVNNQINIQQPMNSYQSNIQQPVNNIDSSLKRKDTKKMFTNGLLFGLGIIMLILLFSNYNKGYYFDNGANVSNNGNIQESNNLNRKGKYNTVIIYDNVYEGVKIEQKSDADSLISKDSVDQKGNCPTEIKSIEDEIINNYGITAVNLCEMDVNFAKEISKVFKKVYDEYPSVRGFLTNLTLVNGSMQDSYIAAFMPFFSFATSDSTTTYPWIIKTQVLLNTSYFLNKAKLKSAIDMSTKAGHFPKNTTIYSPVAHELGHYLSFLAMMKNYDMNSILLIDGSNIDGLHKLSNDFKNGNFSLSMIKEAYEKYKTDKNSNIGFDEWRGTISKYALAKDSKGEYIYDETIAESFHDVYLNSDNAADASRYVISVLKNKLES